MTRHRVLTQTSSTAQIGNADPFVQHKSKKRKLGDDISLPAKSKQPQHATHSPASQVKPVDCLEVVSKLDGDDHKPNRLPLGQKFTPEEGQDKQSAKGEEDLGDTDPRQLRCDGADTQPMGSERHRYFLLRPRTSSSRQVLVPLESTNTLADCLNGRTVLEFPTICAFPNSMAALPEEYMLEEEYIQQEGEEQKEFDELLQELDPEILKRLRDDGRSRERDKEEELDSSRILDVLKQDLGGAL